MTDLEAAQAREAALAKQRQANRRHQAKKAMTYACLVNELAQERSARAREREARAQEAAMHKALVAELIESNAMRKKLIDEMHAQFDEIKKRTDALASLHGDDWAKAHADLRARQDALEKFGDDHLLWKTSTRRHDGEPLSAPKPKPIDPMNLPPEPPEHPLAWLADLEPDK